MTKKALPVMARVLREARARSGMSQQELAHAADVARITIANVELGKHSGIRPSTAYKLAKALGISSEELFGEKPIPKSNTSTDAAEQALDEYETLKKGTIVEPTASERRWLKRMLASWGESSEATSASILFLLLALRHGSRTD